MFSWIFYALAAAFFWGTYSVISRIATSPKYFNLDSSTASLLMLCGASIVFIIYFLIRFPTSSLLIKFIGIFLICALFAYAAFAIQEQGVKLNFSLITTGVLQGIFWSSGMIAVYMALSTGTPIGKIASIYNFNLLVTILLSMLFLREFPQVSDQVKILIGGGFIILGGIIAGM